MIVIPQLGLVRSYSYDSDEEPYYLEKRISFDDQSCTSAIIEANCEDHHEYRKRLYDEYDIDENDEYYDQNLKNDHIYSCDSDEEPYYDEKRLIKEHQRRSKSISRSPPIRPTAENMLGIALTKNFLNLEREIEEDDRSTRTENCEITEDDQSIRTENRDNIIHLGLLGNTRITKTTKVVEYEENITETVVETQRRKYKWEEKVAETITSYSRGDLKTDPPYDDNDDDDDNDEDHMWASENEDTQKSVIERKLGDQSDHDSIDELQDEEVSNGVKSIEMHDEGAVGGSNDDSENATLHQSPKSYDFEKVNEKSLETESFDTILTHIEQETKKINNELSSFLNEEEEEATVDVAKEKIERDRESSITSSEEIRKLEESKAKEKKKRNKKKKKSIGEKTDDFIKLERGGDGVRRDSTPKTKSVGDTAREFIAIEGRDDAREDSIRNIANFDRTQAYDFIKLEHGGDGVRSDSTLKTKSMGDEAAREFIAIEGREESITNIAKFDRTQAYDEFLLNEKHADEDLSSDATIKKSKRGKMDIKSNIQEDGESLDKISTGGSSRNSSDKQDEQPQPHSSTNTKRKSISRPDPLYLLKESMYPFY